MNKKYTAPILLLCLAGILSACGGNPYRSHKAIMQQRENYCLRRGAEPQFCREYAKNLYPMLVQKIHECPDDDKDAMPETDQGS